MLLVPELKPTSGGGTMLVLVRQTAATVALTGLINVLRQWQVSTVTLGDYLIPLVMSGNGRKLTTVLLLKAVRGTLHQVLPEFRQKWNFRQILTLTTLDSVL